MDAGADMGYGFIIAYENKSRVFRKREDEDETPNKPSSMSRSSSSI